MLMSSKRGCDVVYHSYSPVLSNKPEPLNPKELPDAVVVSDYALYSSNTKDLPVTYYNCTVNSTFKTEAFILAMAKKYTLTLFKLYLILSSVVKLKFAILEGLKKHNHFCTLFENLYTLTIIQLFVRFS